MFGTLIGLGIAVALCVLAVDASGEDEADLQAETIRRIRGVKSDAAEIAERFRAETYVAPSGDSLLYRFLEPEGYDPDRTYPLVLCLHGRAGRGRDNVTSIGGCRPAQVLSEPDMRTRYPSFLIVPQASPVECWGFSLDEDTRRERVRQGRSTGIAADKKVLALIEDVAQRWSIDRDRIYVTGQSMGGGGSWHLAITNPDLFAAVMPICGPGSACYADSLVHVPVWAFHGSEDTAVPTQMSRDMVEAIREAGGSPRYTEFEGIGHGCMPLVFDDPDVLPWLFAQRRSRER